MAKKNGMSYLTLGSLFLDFTGHKDATNFYRDLNISNALSLDSYAALCVRTDKMNSVNTNETIQTEQLWRIVASMFNSFYNN